MTEVRWRVPTQEPAHHFNNLTRLRKTPQVEELPRIEDDKLSPFDRLLASRAAVPGLDVPRHQLLLRGRPEV